MISSTLALAVATLAATPQEVYAPCPPGGGVTRMAYGEMQTCSISTPTETDIVQFYGQVGDVIDLRARSNTLGLGVRLELLDPTGATFAVESCQGCGGCSCLTSMVQELDSAGIWTLLISDPGFDRAGDYVIALGRVPGLAEVPVLGYGTTERVTLDQTVDTDWLRFHWEPGTRVTLTARSATLGLGPYVRILSPSGCDLGVSCYVDFFSCQGCGGCHCTATWDSTGVLTEPGDYLLAVTDTGFDRTGGVDISLACIFGSCTDAVPSLPIGSSACGSMSNSTGMPATMSAVGSTVIADNDLLLVANDAPPGRLGLVFAGMNGTQVPIANSQGTLCIAPFFRLGLGFVGNDSKFRFRIDIPNPPHLGLQIRPGDTWMFQTWFRDTNPNATSNTTDRVEVSFS